MKGGREAASGSHSGQERIQSILQTRKIFCENLPRMVLCLKLIIAWLGKQRSVMGRRGWVWGSKHKNLETKM
jgi:hypothetical protein